VPKAVAEPNRLLHIRVRAVMWECGEGQTDTQTAVITIHFASATSHAKRNNSTTTTSNIPKKS